MISGEGLDGLRAVCPGARIMPEGGVDYVFLPGLTVATSKGQFKRDGLVCPVAHPSGYMTRLFLSAPCADCGKIANWTLFHLLEREWHSWSWQNIPATLSTTQILFAH